MFVSDVRHLIQRCPQPRLHVEARRAMLKSVASRLSHLRARLSREDDVHDTLATVGRSGRTWAAKTQEEIDRLLEERYRLRADRNYWTDATLKLKLEALRSAVAVEPRDLARINLALRSLLVKVVVDWENAQLVLHWRHGGETTIGFYRRCQKGGARNLTPTGVQGRRPPTPMGISRVDDPCAREL